MINYLDLQKIKLICQQEIEEKLLQVFRSGRYMLYNEVKIFKDYLATNLSTKQGNEVAKYLDSLQLIFKAFIELGIMQKEMR